MLCTFLERIFCEDPLFMTFLQKYGNPQIKEYLPRGRKGQKYAVALGCNSINSNLSRLERRKDTGGENVKEVSRVIEKVKQEVQLSEWAKDLEQQRQERLKPLFDDLFKWLNELNPVGKTKLAGAVQYCLNERTYLYRCLENGNIPVDNNRAENAIRPFVVGRNNWLFANSVKGAQASAIIYSLPQQPWQTD